MPNRDAVVWSEGMFMRPQHLQQHTRHLEGLIGGVVEAVVNFGWGFSSLELDVSELGAGTLGVSSASGTFPDATPFRLNASDGLPAAIDLTRFEPGAMVYLCLAPRSGSRQTQEFRKTQRTTGTVRYLTHTIDVVDNASELAVHDENDTDYASQRPPSAQIVVGQLQTRLLTDSEESRSCVRLPIARLQDITVNGGARLDPDFVPPVTRLQASTALMQSVRELYVDVSSLADRLARKVGDIGPGAEFSLNLIGLLVANRYDPVLRNLISTGVHPAELYRFLLGMAGEVATLTPAKRPVEFPAYDHDDLSATFRPLFDELHDGLSDSGVDEVEELPMRFMRQHKTWISKITNHNRLARDEFVLAARANLTEDELAQRLPEQMIIAPLEEIDKRESDLRVHAAKIKPKGVPTLNKWVYFHLDQTGSTWEALSDSRGFAFFVDRLDQDFPDLELKFWAVP